MINLNNIKKKRIYKTLFTKEQWQSALINSDHMSYGSAVDLYTSKMPQEIKKSQCLFLAAPHGKGLGHVLMGIIEADLRKGKSIFHIDPDMCRFYGLGINEMITRYNKGPNASIKSIITTSLNETLSGKVVGDMVQKNSVKASLNTKSGVIMGSETQEANAKDDFVYKNIEHLYKELIKECYSREDCSSITVTINSEYPIYNYNDTIAQIMELKKIGVKVVAAYMVKPKHQKGINQAPVKEQSAFEANQCGIDFGVIKDIGKIRIYTAKNPEISKHEKKIPFLRNPVDRKHKSDKKRLK